MQAGAMHWPPALSQSDAFVHVCTAVHPVRPALHTSSCAPLQRYWLGVQSGGAHALASASQSAVVAQVAVVVHPVSGPAHVCMFTPLHWV
jgi:hypothetical protein